MRLYVYGLVESETSVNASGIAASAVRVEPVSGLYAIVSEFPDPSLKTNRENIIAHERVLEKGLEQTTPLPFRFGTVVTSDQLRDFVEQYKVVLAADLARVRGCVQMSVKLIATAGEAVTASNDEGPGSQFLRRKQANRNVVLAAAKELNRDFSDLLRASEITTHNTPRPMASVGHLVEKLRIAEYRSKLRAASATRTDFAWIQSGPWPPYSFVSAGLAMPQAVKA
jgi:hypothetical protein